MKTYTDRPDKGYFYNLTGRPEFTGEKSGEHPLVRLGDRVLKWSADFLPQVGDRVDVKMNGFGPGTVVAYFVESGFLGVEVKVDKRPAWHLEQHGPKARNPLVFGAEIQPEKETAHV